ncbi:Gfo/Idh/MocA family protein [Cytophaga aurantiaca]|uniref:Gfo/Idh/MocA family protein n=1 Tax=Cytophaga aurantiaca TaxID=29530 RepID=UPI000365BB39|nr:Gfo/Idh/MocA family oxidoreductase [Cytophaga aurantiaca]
MKVVIIGLGSIAKKHIAAIRQIKPDAIIIALRSNASADEIPSVENIYSIDDIKSIHPDFIIISNPTMLHGETIEKLIQFNIPLFIEKPALHDLQQEEHISTLLKANNIKTYIACNLRFLDCLVYVKNHLAEKQAALNEVNVYSGSHLPDWRPGTDFRKGYSANKNMGGGAHLDLIHELDYVYWIFGKPLQVSSILRNKSTLKIDAIDYANYTCVYERFVVGIVLNYYRKDYKRTLELVFSDETWLVDLPENKITRADGTVIFKSEQKMIQTYLNQMTYFFDFLNSGSAISMNDFTQGIDVLKICLNNDIKR